MENILEKSFPFDAKLVNGKYDKEYVADDFARYFRAFISSGVFMANRTNLQVIANDDMTVTLKPGELIIDGYRYDLVADLIIQISPADGVLHRIDRIAATWDKEKRDIHYTIREGEYGNSPVAPACRREAECKDYVLADIYVAAGSIAISQTAITDQRLNTDLCGMAAPFAHLDTKLIYDQLQQFYQETTTNNAKWEKDAKQRFEDFLQLVKGQLGEEAEGFLREKVEQLEASASEQEKKTEALEQRMEDALGGFVFYPEELTQAEYNALPEETKATPKLLFVIKKE